MSLIKVDFYQVRISTDAGKIKRPFIRILERVSNLPDDRNRTLPIQGHPFRLQQPDFKGHKCEGQFDRIRMTLLPPVEDLDGKKEPLKLKKDQGLGEEAAFIYNSKLNVIALERNRLVGVSKIEQYLKYAANIDGFIFFEPIIKAESMRRMASLKTLRKLDISFAGVDESCAVFEGLGLSGSALADLHKDFKAPNIKVSVSMGKNRGSLSVENVKKFIRNLSNKVVPGAKDIRKIELTGKIDDYHDKEIIDLLEDRMVENIEIESEGRNTLSYNNRIKAVRDAFLKREDELTSIFGS